MSRHTVPGVRVSLSFKKKIRKVDRVHLELHACESTIFKGFQPGLESNLKRLRPRQQYTLQLPSSLAPLSGCVAGYYFLWSSYSSSNIVHYEDVSYVDIQ